jgi:hypothetical protein
MASFCPSGLWPAVQGLVAFLISNVFSHAASIHLVPGADARTALITILSAIVTPFAMGSHAFGVVDRARRRFSYRLRKALGWKGKLQVVLTPLFCGDALDNAVVSGALAIRIPREYKALTKSWKRVQGGQRLISPASWGYTDTRVQVIRDRCRMSGYFVPWLQFDEGCEDLFVVLPPDTTFNNVDGIKYVVIPNSTLLSQIIAVIQLVLGSRQIFLNYESSVATQGLSSPYLCVIPYLLMTLVNFLANAFAGQYPQVIVLPKVTTRFVNEFETSEAEVRRPEGQPHNQELRFPSPNRLFSFYSQLEDHAHVADLNLPADRFKMWLRRHHPYLNSDEFTFPRQWVPGSWWSSIFLVPAATLLIGFLTHFHAADRSRAAWFLMWLYGMPIISLAYPIAGQFERRWPQRPKVKRTWAMQAVITGMAVVFVVTHLVILIGVFGGTAVISVGLLEAMCSIQWAFSDTTWFKIGFTAFIVVAIFYFVICAGFGVTSISLDFRLLMIRMYSVL